MKQLNQLDQLGNRGYWSLWDQLYEQLYGQLDDQLRGRLYSHFSETEASQFELYTKDI